MNWIDPLVDRYYKFLRDKTVITESSQNGWTEISTPFTGLFNDTLDIYVKRTGGKLILSDDGQTLHNLELSGVQINRSPKRKELLDKILLNYGIRIDDKELITEASEQNFPQKKLNLLSAVSEVNDLYILAKNTIASVFMDDVKNHLDTQHVIYTPYFISKGSTGLEFTFDFQIAYAQSEVLIKAFNSINTLNLPHFLFTWDDVKQVREKQAQKKVLGLAIINNQKQDVKQEYLEALKSRGTEIILWSERNKPEDIKKLKVA